MNLSLSLAATPVELPLRAALALLRSHLDDAGFGSRAPAVAPVACAEVSSEDWDLLFDAVKERLVLAVGERAAPAGGEATAAPARVVVLECVEALDLLHAMLEPERRRRET